MRISALLLPTLILFVNCRPEKEEPLPTALPIVITGEISNVTSTIISAEGQITSDGNLAIIGRGFVIGTSINPTTADKEVSAGDGIGVFSGIITELKRATTYYIRAYATNSIGTSYGMNKMFTTTPELPTIITTDVSSITATTASVGGNIVDNGGAAIIARGVCWSASQNPTIAENKTSDGSEAGIFTSLIGNLKSSTTYYVRSYAINTQGTAYGNQLEFTTLFNPNLNNPDLNPDLTYGSISDIDGNSYPTIVIGTQTWMAVNLKVSHYNNGDAIANVADGTAWSSLSTGAYVYYDNDEIYNSIYGKLYNWYAVTDVRGICPSGWHVPSTSEFATLFYFLGDGGGGKMKAGFWYPFQNLNFNNQTGFTGAAGGARGFPQFFGMGYNGYWWTSNAYGVAGLASAWWLYYGDNNLTTGNFGARAGFSVRCLQD